MMFKQKRVTQAVMFALANAMFASTAIAQTQTVEKIEITGSRIKVIDADAVSPVVVIDAATIRTEGARSAENLVNNLPQAFAAQGATVSNGASGTATVNLRGLGESRSLVLVNGRRLPYGSASIAVPDLNQIPTPLINRVEVLTGGASAVYGSDAVAGVVNFIMNDRFEGVQVELNQSFYNHQQNGSGGVADIVARRALTNPANFAVPGDKDADGRVFDASITMGGNFAQNKGNATVYLGYKKESALLQSERDFSACTVASGATAFTCGGSSTAPTGRITNLGDGKIWTNADGNGTARAYATATDQYNFGPTNFYQRPSERYMANFFANYSLHPNARGYGEFSFMDYRSVAQVAPGGIFGEIASVSFDNPLLSQSWRTALGLLQAGDTADVVVQRRNVEGGGRQSEFRNTSFRSVLGVKGDIGNWAYDAFFQTAKVISQQTEGNYFSTRKILKALDVVNVDGVARCRSAVDGSDPACIPYNVWKNGGITPEQIAYLSIPGIQKGSTQQAVQNISVTGDLGAYGWKLPGARNAVSVALGAERRVEKIERTVDEANATGDLSGSGGPTNGIRGEYSLNEVFGELRVPILEKQPFAESLLAQASYRYSDYSTGNTANTYGLGLEWSPVKLAKVRGTFQRAVRAPDLIELFRAQGNNLFDMDSDPCAGATPTATREQCARTGVTAAQYGNIQDSPAGQYNFLAGGNPALKPETSKSFTIGMVLAPLPNFTATVDFFDIKVDDTIGTVSSITSLNKCLQTGDPRFCSLVQRDRLGTLWLLNEGRIIETNVNIGKQSTRGVDIGFTYQTKLPTGYGSIGFDGVGTYLTKLATEEIKGEGSYDCVGLYGNICGTPTPKWRHKFRVTWNTPWAIDAGLTWRYFNSVRLDASTDDPLLSGAFGATDERLGSRSYFDLSLTYNYNKNLSFNLGISNLTDRDPPLSGTAGPAIFGNGNTFPQVYDALGRKVFLNVVGKI